MEKNGLKHTAAQGLTIVLALVLMLALMPVMGEKAMAVDGIDDTATSFTMNDYTYTILDTDNPSVRLDAYLGSASELTVPQTVTHDGITYKVRTIQTRAFTTDSLKSVRIPRNVKNIGKWAFGYYWYDGLDEEDLTLVPMIGKKTGFRIYGKKRKCRSKIRESQRLQICEVLRQHPYDCFCSDSHSARCAGWLLFSDNNSSTAATSSL
ncbi:hypothetical protein CXIVA_04770 [Clostridium sp. SY8519]|uniref:hypothetical protein n=1 Tax=Clostridium sp. (strain SY8519) TaxID=1042156 RepID=UPI0002171B9D|nr:hypothetical protein [Clostridium sp. SY8519]BAK46444.1 hypothetical protein CXIVA_04770 [Clostridium sp. SY8519]